MLSLRDEKYILRAEVLIKLALMGFQPRVEELALEGSNLHGLPGFESIRTPESVLTGLFLCG